MLAAAWCRAPLNGARLRVQLAEAVPVPGSQTQLPFDLHYIATRCHNAYCACAPRKHKLARVLLACCSRVARVLTHRFAIVLQMPQTSFRPCSSRMQSLDVAFSSFVSPLCFLTLSSVMPPCEALWCVRACADTGRVVGTGTPLLASRRMLVCATLSLLPSARWQDAKVTWPLGLR